MCNVQQQVADFFGVDATAVATNLWETGWPLAADWGKVAHGCALAAVGLLFEERYKSLLIPSTHRYDDLIPWGSHPLTDPLLSTNSLKVIHDGAAYSRVAKSERLSKCELALSTLQVCWETKAYANCEKCEKCCWTMAILMLLGALERCSTFTAAAISPKALIRASPRDDCDRALLLKCTVWPCRKAGRTLRVRLIVFSGDAVATI